MGGFQNTRPTLIRISYLPVACIFYHDTRIYAKELLSSALIKVSSDISYYIYNYYIFLKISYINLSLYTALYILPSFRVIYRVSRIWV
jgi:hypothetical protein